MTESRSHMFVLIAVMTTAAIFLVLLSSSFVVSFAQQQLQNGTSNTNVLSLKNSTGNNIPILEKTSDKGIYKVRLSWPTAVADAANGLQVQIDFLNASVPVGTNATVPQKENVSGGSGASSHASVPTSMDSPLPVKSYNMIIYTSDGKELWKQTNQPGLGGRGTQRIILNNNYTGPVTVEITNIVPGWTTGGTNTTITSTPSTSSSNNMTDSVKFTATIVPEFPAISVALPLTISIASIIVAIRLRQRII